MSDRKNYFNKKDVYTDKIEPLINQLKKACNLEKMLYKMAQRELNTNQT